MKAEDTVMNETLIQVWVLEFMQPGELDLNAKLKEFAQAQAETSFKAGIREYHQFMNTRCEHFVADLNYVNCPCKECYKAKLKEWGIEE